MNATLIRLSVSALSFALLTACGGAPETREEARPGSDFGASLEGAPCWVMRGCACFSGDDAKRLCGVGIMGGTNDLSMCMDTALDRGRTKIAAALDRAIKELVEDYRQTVTGGADYGKKAADEQAVTRTAQQVTNLTLPGTNLVDSWVSKRGECVFLVALDPDTFRAALASTTALDAEVRAYVLQNAERAFERLNNATGGK